MDKISKAFVEGFVKEAGPEDSLSRSEKRELNSQLQSIGIKDGFMPPPRLTYLMGKAEQRSGKKFNEGYMLQDDDEYSQLGEEAARRGGQFELQSDRLTKNKQEKYERDQTKEFLSSLGLIGASYASKPVLQAVTDMDESVEKGELQSFLDDIKSKRNLDTSISINNRPTESYFQPSEDFASVGKNRAIAAHELGHAANSKIYKKIFGDKGGQYFGSAIYNTLSDVLPARLSGRIGPLADVPFAGYAAMPLATETGAEAIGAGTDEGLRQDISETVKKYPELPMAAGLSPKLIEEGTASARGLADVIRNAPAGKRLSRGLKGAGTLGSAFSTYLIGSAIPMFGAHTLGEYRRSKNKISPETVEDKMDE